ncbi:hypothetical protein M7775_01980 [Sporomusa sphaeroides DSM 2875]|uniref:hypothetical protein n=1 Tax=Sporomusa sphaeroides TaxID=47679 RepID=UPI00202F34D5|nr:hypothetical protein [Sporomusa sphaeroides]MCM0757336.1 hypothetical protein [Sporomusa sphaeroides DSM 2875]
MKYFAEFDADGNRTAGYVADGKPYIEDDIRMLFPNAVEIPEEDQALYANVAGQYIRDPETTRPVLKSQYVPTVEEKLTNLDAEYQPQFADLAQSLGLAMLDDNTELIAELKADYADLKQEYQTKREAIQNAN